MGVKLNYIPMVTNSLKLNPFTHRAARHEVTFLSTLEKKRKLSNKAFKHLKIA